MRNKFDLPLNFIWYRITSFIAFHPLVTTDNIITPISEDSINIKCEYKYLEKRMDPIRARVFYFLR